MNKITTILIIVCFLVLPIVVNAKELQIGDYIELVPDAETYTISKDFTGYNIDQTLTPNELTLWRVIAINDDGTIDVVSKYTSSNDIYFNGINGYKYYVKVLQDISSAYKNEKFTVKTRMIGYNGQTLVISDTSSFDGTTNIAPSTTTTPQPTSELGEEFQGGVLGDTLYIKDYQLLNIIGEGMTYRFNTTSPASYWYCSRFYNYMGNNFHFSARKFNSFGGSVQSSYLRDYNGSYWFDTTPWAAVRPIVTLKSNILIIEGEGTYERPYIIGVNLYHNIELKNDNKRGLISCRNLNEIEEGANVIFTVIPKSDYLIERIEIKDANNNIINYRTTNTSNEYTFVMPNSNVIIKPIYKKAREMNAIDVLRNPKTETGISLIIITIVLFVSSIVYMLLKRNKKNQIK